MRLTALTRFCTLTLAAGALAADATAQEGRGGAVVRPAPFGEARAYTIGGEDGPRAVLGLSTSPSNSRRDTLGLLVSTIVPGGPADRAGIEEGNRLQSINGVSLRISAADAEDWEASSFLSRRLTRELGKLKPGDEAELRVYGGGQARTLRVRTADTDSLYRRSASNRIAVTAEARRREADDRPTLGISLGSSGSKRDTLGVLVIGVSDESPAAKAGIEEGNRIAAIDGINLRVSREDLDDDVIASSRARRLSREVAAKKAGDEVELRVYANGQFRTVRLRLARQGDLPRRRGSFIIGDGFSSTFVPAMPSIAPQMRYEIERLRDIGPMIRSNIAPMIRSNLRSELQELRDIGPSVRENVERALREAGYGLGGLRMELEGLDGLRELEHIGDDVGRALEGLRFEIAPSRAPTRSLAPSPAPTAPAARTPVRAASLISM